MCVDFYSFSRKKRTGLLHIQYTVVAFLNSGSGGGVGKLILKDMQTLLGQEFVFDLRKCGRGNMPSDNVSTTDSRVSCFFLVY